ncbi:hypothetical protein QR680_000805 [Steinernema hermaphroditum]|uniref:Serine palmitoyltransferase 1 n=1 Tax=Steinernema hermaphroditum TaxID=289476 RepID=A0AA39GVX7_9BILA|nr:hypothetical protein QR680_000805 [Steinernema hermaphroditum]
MVNNLSCDVQPHSAIGVSLETHLSALTKKDIGFLRILNFFINYGFIFNRSIKPSNFGDEPISRGNHAIIDLCITECTNFALFCNRFCAKQFGYSKSKHNPNWNLSPAVAPERAQQLTPPVPSDVNMEILGAVFSFHYAFEALLIAVVIYLLFFRRKPKPVEPKMSERQKDELIDEWTPEPLTPESPQDHPVLNPKFIDGKMGKYVSVDGKKCLNMATSNFLGLIDNERIEEVAKKTIFKYGVGSCGPRGFYGTVDVHLELEKQIAKFMGAEEAVLYSYGFATIASAIPAYAKRGDVVFVDKGCNFAIQKGVQASRSRIEWFNHNDMEDLERLLLIQAAKDKQNPKKAATTRRFIVVEGLYANSGDLCPLPQLMELKWKYKVRIFIDESFSFGVLLLPGTCRSSDCHYMYNM